MKISVFKIVRDHVRTLRDAGSGKILKVDLIVFYILPLLLASLIIDLTSPSEKFDWSDQAMTFFGIFLALLINVQVALFAVLQRQRNQADNQKRAGLDKDDLKNRRLLLGEMNSTISYLNLVCVVALVASLAISVFSIPPRTSVYLLLILYTHFLLTMLMVLKRAHALFQKEYEKE